MPLRIRDKQSDKKVKSARRQVDLALLRMTNILDEVQKQVNEVKEELDERRAD